MTRKNFPTNDKEAGVFIYQTCHPFLFEVAPLGEENYPSEFLAETPVIKKHINKRKINKSLLTHILHIYMGITQRVTQRSGFEFKHKYHLNRGRSGCTYVS